jgi:PAS domain S-box-containing protein
MNRSTPDWRDGTDLRRRAEARLQEERPRPDWWTAPDALSPDAARSLVHELQAHQVELEMQNEELLETQASLEASRNRYQDLYELAPVGYLTAGEDGTLLEANLTFATMLGMDRSTILRRPLSRFVVPEDQDALYMARRRLFETGERQAFEARLRRDEGGPLWVSFEMVPARNSVGADDEARLLAAVSDITVRKAAEAQGETLSTLEMILQHTHVATACLDRDFKFLWVNTAYAAACRQDRSFFPGRNHFDLYPHTENQALFQRVVDSGLPFFATAKPFEFPGQPGRGTTYWDWSLAPVKAADGAVTRLVFTLTDVTARTRWEQALRDSESRFAAMFNQAPMAYQSLDADGRFLEVNPAWLSALGYRRDEVIGKWFGDFLAPEFVEAFRERFPQFKAAGRIHSEFEMLNRRGERRHIAFEGRVGYAPDGTFQQTHCIFVDTTERTRAEEALARQNDELNRFAYTVSHDLKSPLVTVQTFLGYLEQNMARQDAAAVKEDLGFIHKAADKMGRLLDEILTLARAGLQQNPSTQMPLQAVVDEALALVAGQVSARGVQVTVTDAPVVLVGDRERLVGVFQNLLDNAVKFLGDQAFPRIEVGAESIEDEVVFFVRDNGIGIEPGDMRRIFGIFERLDPGSAGSGLGLALVKRIVEGHGGRIWVESAGPGQGTTFRFTLSGTRMDTAPVSP